ncbi:MAG: hypothetical protein ABEH64_13880 [Salinirussus sp.]
MDEGADVLESQPVAGLVLAVAVAAVGYAAVIWVLDGRVDLLETVIFAVVLAVVYVGFTEYFGV